MALKQVEDDYNNATPLERAEKVTGQAQLYYSDSEIDLIKLRLRENSEIAMAKQRDRGTAISPKIKAARAALTE